MWDRGSRPDFKFQISNPDAGRAHPNLSRAKRVIALGGAGGALLAVAACNTPLMDAVLDRTVDPESRFGRPVLMPTSVPSASTISSMCRYLRVGDSCSDSQIGDPGVVRPRIDPVFGQEPVIRVPSARSASKRKRL